MKNSSNLLSICIPTYNRVNDLVKLLKSIDSKFESNIEIIIVDDGSTDNTKKSVEEFFFKSNMHIKYAYQENMGRSYALHKAILLTKSEYIVIMDSDDLFVKNGVDTIISKILPLMGNKNKNNMAGFVFLCSNFDGTIIGDKFPENMQINSLLKFASDYQVSGDKKEVVRTKIIKDVLYTPYENEKRMATSIMWNRISLNFNIHAENEVVSMKGYAEDGMSSNIDCIRLQSPKSSAEYYGELFYYHNKVYCSYKHAFRAAINLIRYSIHLQSMFFIKKYYLSFSKKMLLLVLTPVSAFLAIRDRFFCKF